MENRELFEEMPIPKAVRTLMVPTIISSLVTVVYSLADTFFVGMLNNEVQSAAVAFAAPGMMLFYAANNLFGVGASSMMSRALGAGDIKTVKKSAAFGFYGAAMFGIMLSLVFLIFKDPIMVILGTTENAMEATDAYMKWAVICGAVPSILNVVCAYLVRSEGAALHASIGTMSGCIMNIILDPIFILPQGLNMGAAGAGCATFLSNCLACLYFVVLLLFIKKGKTNISLNPKYITFEKKIVFGILAVGIPAAIQNLLNVTGMTILNNSVAAYGAAAVAAIGISHKIYMMPMQIAFGGSQGVMPLIGYSYSSKNKKRFEDSIKMVIKIMLPTMVLISIFCWIFAPQLIGIFIGKPEVIAYGEMFLRGSSVGIPFLLLDFTAVGVFMSVGLGKHSLIFAILRKIVFEIPAIIILNKIFGAAGITYSMFVAELILAAAGLYILRKIIRDFDKAR